MKTKTTIMAVMAALLLTVSLVGCTIDVKETSEEEPVATESENPTPEPTPTSESTPAPTPEPTPASQGPSASMMELLNSKCSARPDTLHIDRWVNGQHVVNYDEVRGEVDTGGEIADVSQAFVSNLKGVLFVEPSPDAKLYWAARKWTLAEGQQRADEALASVTISSNVVEGEAQVVVDHPNDTIPGVRYEACLVAKVPTSWTLTLDNSSGDITSLDHEGPLSVSDSSGEIVITQKGSGSVDAVSSSGGIDISQTGSGNVTAEASSGEIVITTQEGPGSVNAKTSSGGITITQRSSGSVTAETSSGGISVEAGSVVGVSFTSSSGSVTYTLTDGGVPLQIDSSISTTSGSVDLILAEGVGLRLDAETDSGSIGAPSLPAPVEDEERGVLFLVTDINGGGATLTVRTTSGTIRVQ